MYGNKPPHESWNSTSNDSVKEVMNKETQHTKETTMLIRQAVQYAATDNKCLKKSLDTSMIIFTITIKNVSLFILISCICLCCTPSSGFGFMV